MYFNGLANQTPVRQKIIFLHEMVRAGDIGMTDRQNLMIGLRVSLITCLTLDCCFTATNSEYFPHTIV